MYSSQLPLQQKALICSIRVHRQLGAQGNTVRCLHVEFNHRQYKEL